MIPEESAAVDDGASGSGAVSPPPPGQTETPPDKAQPAPSAARRRRLVVIGMTLAAVAAVAFAAVAVVIANHRSANMMHDDTGATLVVYDQAHQMMAPQLDLAMLGSGSGQRFRLTALGREPLVINFFASWCTACQAELGAVASVARSDAARVPFFGVDTNDTSESTAQIMLRRVHADYPVGVGTTTQAGEFLVTGLPTTIFVNAHGRVVATAYGQLTRAELSTWVNELGAGTSPQPLH